MEDVDDENLKEELQMFKHFLVDSIMENWRYWVVNFGTDTLDPEFLLQFLDSFYRPQKCN